MSDISLDVTAELDQAIELLLQRFIVPDHPESIFRDLDKQIDAIASPFQETARAFKHNLHTVLTASALPYTLASAAAYNSNYQRIHIAERIRSRSRAISEEERDVFARCRARERMKEFSDSREGRTAIVHHVCEYLNQLAMDEMLVLGAHQLLEQALVMTWSGFEVLARDLFEQILNVNPSKLEDLYKDPDVRKHLTPLQLSIDLLVRHDYNVAGKLGTIIAEQINLSSLRTIRLVYAAIFNEPRLAPELKSKNLWLTFQRRNLFVHRRGIVDHVYLEKTGEAVAVGSKLKIAPKQFEKEVLAPVFGCRLRYSAMLSASRGAS